MKILGIIALVLTLFIASIKAQAVQPDTSLTCPEGYEHGYVWTDCFQYNGEGCYGIRYNGVTNSVVSCPLACCIEDYVEWVR